jgi:uncharacterized lipoprotein NlpE involved in copper resistance
MNKTFVPSILLALGLSACGTPGSAIESAANLPPAIPAASSHGSEEIAGVYRGVLPCADCSGIETTLALSQNGKFTLRSRYLKNRPFSVPAQTGTWKITGAIVELFPAKITPATANDRLCFGIADSGALVQFDISCAPIEGAGAGRLIKTRK